MVDLLLSRKSLEQSEKMSAQEDYEEGELVEEGEITDDDEDCSPAGAGSTVTAAKQGNEGALVSSRAPDRAAPSFLPKKHNTATYNNRSNEDVQTKALLPHPPSKGGSAEPKTAWKRDAAGGGESMMPEGGGGTGGGSGGIWGEGDRDYRQSAEADKDYRWGGADERQHHYDNNGDFDYRDRRRRRSPTPTMEEPKRARVSPPTHHSSYPTRGGIGTSRGGGGGGRRQARWMERQLCKFFREGYCRDGDHCSYSHNVEDGGRKMELCKFYQNGYCKKGMQCGLLHGEFPCKAFHKGECSRDMCNYSHMPLTEATRPLYERMLAEEQFSSRLPPPPPPQAMRRRVLLPGGPLPPPSAPAPSLPPQQSPLPKPSPFHSEYLPPAGLPPPSVVVPTLSAPPMPPAPASIIPSFPPTTSSAPSSTGFNISQMLAQIAGSTVTPSTNSQSSLMETTDSPASPPPCSLPSEIPLPSQARYRLIHVDVDSPYANMPQSLLSSASKSDPRIARFLDSEFDAATSLIASATSAPRVPPVSIAPSLPIPPVPSYRPMDPRQAALRDPRRKPEERKEEREEEGRPRMSWMPQIG